MCRLSSACRRPERLACGGSGRSADKQPFGERPVIRRMTEVLSHQLFLLVRAIC